MKVHKVNLSVPLNVRTDAYPSQSKPEILPTVSVSFNALNHFAAESIYGTEFTGAFIAKPCFNL